MKQTDLLLAIVGGGLVTWFPRILPFLLVRYRKLPERIVRFLEYLPLSILFALALSSLLEGQPGHFPKIKWAESLAVIPTAWVAFRTRDLMKTVLVGVVAMALIRWGIFR